MRRLETVVRDNIYEVTVRASDGAKYADLQGDRQGDRLGRGGER